SYGFVAERVRRQAASGDTGVNTSLIDVLHHTAHKDALAIGQAVHVHFRGVVQEVIQQHGRVIADLDRFAHVAIQVLLCVHGFHSQNTQNVDWAYHQWVTDLGSRSKHFDFGTSRTVWRLTQTQLGQQLLETLTVFGHVNGFRA